MIEEMIRKCPICGIGEIKIRCREPRRTMMNAKSSEKTIRIPAYIQGKYTVLSPRCPHCGKTKKEIEKYYNETKPPSREEIVKRAKEAGLPLKF